VTRSRLPTLCNEPNVRGILPDRRAEGNADPHDGHVRYSHRMQASPSSVRASCRSERIRVSLTCRVVAGAVALSCLSLAAGCSGCEKKPEPVAEPVASASAAAAPGASANASANPRALRAQAAASAQPAFGTGDMSSLFGNMGVEAKNRPAITPNADQALAAFATAKLAVIDAQQSLGTTYKAAYCKHGLTPAKDVAVLVCEYPDPAAAEVGLAASNKMFATMPRRKSWAHKSLMMALMPQDPKSPPAALAEIDKLAAAFNAL